MESTDPNDERKWSNHDDQDVDETALNAFVLRAVDHLGAGYLGVMVSLAIALGLYRALAEPDRSPRSELAEQTDCAERYVRDWAYAQAAAGYVTYDAARRAPSA